MDIKSPKAFETSDKAHADLFNEMVKVLLENDSGLLDELANHTGDTKPHASEAEKKKWNESQIYKITADNGTQLINVPVGSTIFDAIKDKGTCTFIASQGVEDSPAPSNAYLRGIQTVGQNNIGTGFAVDTAGNAYYFYYNSSHISITWTQLPTAAEKSKWNNGQLSKITADNGTPSIYVRDVNDSILDKIIDKGLGMGTFYAVSNSKDLPEAARSIRGIYHITDTTNGKGSFGWVYATDFANVTYHNYLNNGSWRGWRQVLTDEDAVTEAEKDKWNGGQLYKITQDSGERKPLPTVLDGTDILSLPPGRYYAAGQYLTNKPTTNDSSYFNIDVEGIDTRKDIHVCRSFDNIHWLGTVHTGGVFKGWKRIITDADFENAQWLNVTLDNGSSIGDRPVQYAKWGNSLLLRGHLKANRDVICGKIPITGLPKKGLVTSVPVSGTTGICKLIIYGNGDMKLIGLLSAKDSAVTGYYLDKVVPLD